MSIFDQKTVLTYINNKQQHCTQHILKEVLRLITLIHILFIKKDKVVKYKLIMHKIQSYLL